MTKPAISLETDQNQNESGRKERRGISGNGKEGGRSYILKGKNDSKGSRKGNDTKL